MGTPFFYGWAIVAASFVTLTTYGVFYAQGLFFAPLMERFEWSRAEVSLAFTIYMATYTLAALPMGWLYDRYGPRVPLGIAALLVGGGIAVSSLTASLWQLYLFFGVVAGVGFGAIYPVPVATVVKWFARRRGMAVGIVTSGSGVGIFVLPRVIERLIGGYGWEVAFQVTGLVFFVLIGLSALVMRGSPEETKAKAGSPAPVSTPDPGERRSLTPRQALGTQAFWMLYLAVVFAAATDRMASLELIDYAGSLGIPRGAAAGALGFMGLGGIAGRLFLGILSDRLGRKNTLALCFALQGVTLLAMSLASGAAMLSLLMGILGLAYGGFVALYGPIIGEFFGLAHMGKVIGLCFTNGIWAAILGPYILGGYLVDATGGYQWSFILAGVACGIGAVLAFLSRPPIRATIPRSM